MALCIAMGDQKLQDYLCGHMSINLGNACCIHHLCIASAVFSSLISFNRVLSPGSCKPLPSLAMQRLNNLAQLNMKESDGSQECRLAIAHIDMLRNSQKQF